MGRIKPIMAAVISVGVICGGAVAAAPAAERTKVLPEPTALAPVSFLMRAPITVMIQALGGTTIHCSNAIAEGSGAFTSPNLGTAKGVLTECLGPLESICTGEGDRSGLILLAGTIHYVLALEMTTGTATTLVGAFALLLPQFHITCERLGIKELVLARGCIAGRDDSAERLTTKVRVLFRPFTTGETRILEILPPEATAEVRCLPEVSIGAGAFTLAALTGPAGETELVLERWAQNGREIEVLLMNR